MVNPENNAYVTDYQLLNFAISALGDVKFDGSNCNVDEFLISCNHAFEMIPEADHSKLLAAVKIKITGEARNRIKNRQLGTWTELKNYLRSEFTANGNFLQAQLELNSCRQKRGENVTSYVNRIENCYKNLTSSLDSNLTPAERATSLKLINSQTKASFIMGLEREISILVRARDPEDLETAISIARAESQLSNVYSQNSSNNSFSNFCHICNVSNHSTVNCRFNVKNKRNDGNNSGGRKEKYENLSKNVIQCHYCQKLGHYKRDCRKRRWDEQNSNRNTNQNDNGNNFVNGRSQSNYDKNNVNNGNRNYASSRPQFRNPQFNQNNQQRQNSSVNVIANEGSLNMNGPENTAETRDALGLQGMSTTSN